MSWLTKLWNLQIQAPHPARTQLLQNVSADAEGFGIGPDERYGCEDPIFTLAIASCSKSFHRISFPYLKL